MRFLFKLILRLTLLSVVAAGVMAWFALDQQPLVRRVVELSHSDIARAKQIIKQNDPRGKPAGTEHRVQISERDLNLAVNYLVQRVARIKGAVRARLEDDAGRITGSLRLPDLPFRHYLNISLTVANPDGRPEISDLRVGRLDVPDPLARAIADAAIGRFFDSRQVELVEDTIKQVEFDEGRVSVSFLWKPTIIDQARATLIGDSEQEALNAYSNELAALHAKNQAHRGSITGVMQSLFGLAQRRSQSGADPVAENRALLLVLGAWAMNQGTDRLVSRRVQKGRIRPFRLVLNRRRDLAQHFLVSSAIASNSDTLLADAAGLFKEVQDSRHGSGFSFADLAADRAGTRFGEEATRSAVSAREMQKLLASGVMELDIMPRSKDLPENISAEQFKRRYGEIGSRDYNRIAEEIERRIAACSIYQGR
jgi:hypothetical protein